MDPQEIGRLRDFSDTLTHVLGQLDGKYRELTMGSSKMLNINSTLDKHTAMIQSLERSREEQNLVLNDALKAQTNLTREALDMTALQCSELQKDLVALRGVTKQELDRLQGNLERSFFDSMETMLTKAFAPSTEFPTITREMAPEKILSIMNGRINSLEGQMKIQLVTNQMLKNSLTNESKIHDRFDELSSRLVTNERYIESEKRRISKLEKGVAHVQTVQANIDKSLKIIDQKISLLAAAQFNGIMNASTQHSTTPSGTSLSVQQQDILQFLQSPLPNIEEEKIPIVGNGERLTGPRDPQRVTAMKNYLKEKRLSTIEGSGDGKSNSPSRPPSHSRHTTLAHHQSSLQDFDDANATEESIGLDKEQEQYDLENGLSSVDSQGLLDEFVLERIDNLDNLLHDHVMSKVTAHERISRQLTTELRTVQETIKELEVISSDYQNKTGGGGGGRGGGYSDQEKMKTLIYELKEAWEKGYEEIEKKFQKMDTIMKQTEMTTGTIVYPDEIYKKEMYYKNKIRVFLDNLDHTLQQVSSSTPTLNNSPAPTLSMLSPSPSLSSHQINSILSLSPNSLSTDYKEILLHNLSPMLTELYKDTIEIIKIESNIRENLSQKVPGVSLPISYLPTKLPDTLRNSQKKSLAFLNKGINKMDLYTTLMMIKDQLSTLVSLNSYQQNNEDIKIALTLKADQKIVDNLILKKASVVDLQRFREYVNDEIDSMRETLVKNASNSMKIISNITGGGAAGGGVGIGGNSEQVVELNERFHIILQQFNEIKKNTNSYVPREEIEIALQAILDEMKEMKKGIIEKEILQEKLKNKADKDEVEKLLNLLSSSIGDPSNNHAFAMHLRCLSCDKPLNPFGINLPSSDEGERWPSRDETVSPISKTRVLTSNRPLTSKSTSQLQSLPPVSTMNPNQTGDRGLKSRQNQKGKPSNPGVQGSYLTSNRS